MGSCAFETSCLVSAARLNSSEAQSEGAVIVTMIGAIRRTLDWL